MPLLEEYALTPDIFDTASYQSDEIGNIRLQNLKEVLLTEGLVRNLRDGLWLSLFGNDGRPWHHRGKELLKKLSLQRRFRLCGCALPGVPATDLEWCQEAIASHGLIPIRGIITTSPIADSFRHEPLVASIGHLANSPWWIARSSSVRLEREKHAYAENLNLVIKCANSIMFIDPHLDPSQQRYQDFVSLFSMVAGRRPSPLIEIHRVCYVGSGRNRQFISEDEWKTLFRDAMTATLQTAGLSAEIFVWDDFHDRYMISDLIGISVPNGFDTTSAPHNLTTWTRLGRKDRDDIQREFDPAANRHSIRHRFKIP